MNSPGKGRPTREQIHEIVWKVAAEHTDKSVDELRPEHRLIQDLGADSLTVAEMAMELEEKLDTTIPEEVLDKPELTLGQVEQAICDRLLGPQ
jgi:acyl carrier protein